MSQIAYSPGNSFVYSTHPLLKGLLCFCSIIFFSLNSYSIQITTAVLVAMLAIAALGKVPLLNVILSIRRIAILIVFVGLVQGFRDESFSIILALSAIMRILGVFITAGIFVTVSSQSELMYFWEKVFSPLRFFGMPSRELALVMVIAVRFLPVIMAEMDRIRMAQIARGAELDKKRGIIASAKTLMPLMIPTLSQAILRAGELAEAMEARGYRVSANRTNYFRYRLSFVDFLALPTSLAFFAFTIASRLY